MSDTDRLIADFSISFREQAIEAFRNDVAKLQAENQRLRDALVLLADNVEAYLGLERDGQRNYPESLGLCVDEARLVLIGTPSEDTK